MKVEITEDGDTPFIVIISPEAWRCIGPNGEQVKPQVRAPLSRDEVLMLIYELNYALGR